MASSILAWMLVEDVLEKILADTSMDGLGLWLFWRRRFSVEEERGKRRSKEGLHTQGRIWETCVSFVYAVADFLRMDF
jgi:hypothetical protein